MSALCTQTDYVTHVYMQVPSGQIPYPRRTNDHAVTVDTARGAKPARGACCLVQVKDVDVFWDTLDCCWNSIDYLHLMKLFT
jgi:hypothetical protein